MSDYKKNLVIIGVGNYLQADEGVGIHAINELSKEKLDARVKLVDGGTAGIDLLFWLEGAGFVIIIDCLEAKAEPGTIFRLTAEEMILSLKEAPKRKGFSLHDIDLKDVLLVAKRLNMLPPTIIFGIQPREITVSHHLSGPVKRALPKLIQVVKEEISLQLKTC
jgi:hydrogenase maturation protease